MQEKQSTQEASFDAVNYSLRPSKSIQRQLVFDAMRRLHAHMELEQQVYIGFGSIWFTDFVMAHKILGLRQMISIESHPIGFARAKFNVPYSMVTVKQGKSTDVLPDLLQDNSVSTKPWLVWLDYDYAFDASVKADAALLLEKAPENSTLLLTINGNEKKYGRPNERADVLRDLFGDVVPDDLSKDACVDDAFQETLADLALAYMTSKVSDERRVGGFQPCFRLIYKDSTPMVTIGGVLPGKGSMPAVAAAIAETGWPSLPANRIVAPHLTMREAAVMQALLPRGTNLTRGDLQKIGFDLEDQQIDAYQTYYLQYPAFAQIVS